VRSLSQFCIEAGAECGNRFPQYSEQEAAKSDYVKHVLEEARQAVGLLDELLGQERIRISELWKSRD
jgi:hypothetical protein